jgi:4-hydroxy-tetrahydrodipicolinate synthase
LKVGNVRLPLQPLEADEKQRFASVITELKRNVANISSGASHG